MAGGPKADSFERLKTVLPCATAMTLAARLANKATATTMWASDLHL